MEKSETAPIVKTTGLVLGIVFFAILLSVPFGSDARIHRMAAVAALMATWWMTEAIPLAATSLMPLVLMPILKISQPEDVARSYMNDYIFLFIGGFTIALTMERWNLHRRLALHIVRRVGDRPSQLVLGFMIATALVSMWISNTATAMMMMPIALSVVLLAEECEKKGNAREHERFAGRFGVALMLGVAYAASIGGLGTLVGTPPNAFFAGCFHKEFPGAPEISFARWMLLVLPLCPVMLLVTWALLTFVLHPLRRATFLGGREAVQRQLAEMGPISRAETGVFIVFVAAAFLWIFRLDIPIGKMTIPGWSNLLGLVESGGEKQVAWVRDGTVAMLAALSLFFIPSGRRKGERLVDWKTIQDLPWNVLFLFGGGFALANGLETSGLSNWIGEQCAALHGMPVMALVLVVVTFTTFLTELTSNIAVATMILPILADVCRAAMINPLVPMLSATIVASFAFMLPVATPPNAIVFGTGYVPLRAMIRAGLILDLVGIVLVALLIYYVAIPLWGIDPAQLPASWLPQG
ncbi:anion permease [Candidatus Sumerlaeota bacterium]|nr:anion permease [Candidatus Sumerlaeota bacterium]